MYFKDRKEAGLLLAQRLKKYKNQDVVIYALPRGGVVVALEIAKYLHAPLDLIIIRKISHPYQPEYAIGAIAENGHGVFNEEEVLNIDKNYLANEIAKQQQEARRRREVYLGARKPISCKGTITILVDDGIATGLTIKAAIKELKLHHKPKKIIVAVPVAPKDIVDELQLEGVKFMVIDKPSDFLHAVGAYYEEFNPVGDKKIIKIINSELIA